MTTIKEKRKYEKPAMQVCELQHRLQLLQMSGLDPFDPGSDPLNS